MLHRQSTLANETTAGEGDENTCAFGTVLGTNIDPTGK